MTGRRISLAAAALTLALGLGSAFGADGTPAAIPAPGPHAAASCVPRKLVSYPVKVYQNAMISVPVDVGGETKEMLLDPYQAKSAVTEQMVQYLQVRPVNISGGFVTRFVYYMGQNIQQTIVVPRINFGPASVFHHKVYLIANFTGGGAKIAGVLGADLLYKYDVELDLTHGKVRLFTPEQCKGQGAYWADSSIAIPVTFADTGTVRVPMQLDGKTVEAAISTSGSFAMMHMPTAQRLFGITHDTPGLKLVNRAPNGSQKLYRYPFHKLSAGELAINNPAIGILETWNDSSCNGRTHYGIDSHYKCGWPELTLSLDVLARLRLYLATKQKMLYVTGWNATRTRQQQAGRSP